MWVFPEPASLAPIPVITLRLLMLKLCIGTNFSENKSVPLSPQFREEVRKLDQYIDDMQLLCKYHIGTADSDSDAVLDQLYQAYIPGAGSSGRLLHPELNARRQTHFGRSALLRHAAASADTALRE